MKERRPGVLFLKKKANTFERPELEITFIYFRDIY